MDDGAGIEIFLGCLACFHADTLLDGAAGDQVQGNLFSHFFASLVVGLRFSLCHCT
jgi:hypothetical protein